MHLLEAKGLSFTENVFICICYCYNIFELGGQDSINFVDTMACYVLKIFVLASSRHTAFCAVSLNSFSTLLR